jgi:hypothetical protein
VKGVDKMKNFNYFIKDKSKEDLANLLKDLFDSDILKNENRYLLNISLSILDIIESISLFLKTTKEYNTIIDFEEKIIKFSGKGFPYKNDLTTLISIVSDSKNFEYFVNQLKTFEIIMRGWLVEEIRIVYNESNVDEIFKKYELVFYNFEIMKSKILNTADKLENFLMANGYRWEEKTTNDNVAKSMAATSDWKFSSNNGAIGNDLSRNNKSGFSALPGGCRYRYGDFDDLGYYGHWWSSSKYDINNAHYYYLFYDDTDFFWSFYHGMASGFSVRCVFDL